MAEKDTTERRVYVLPVEQLDRIRAFQAASGIASEVEAVRRLLDSALQMRDTVQDIVRKLKSRYAEERDLRVLARDVLTTHALVENVRFNEGSVEFSLKGDSRGLIKADGSTFTGHGPMEHEDDWDVFPPPPPRRPPSARQGGGAPPSWDAPKGGDLDDEIPF